MAKDETFDQRIVKAFDRQFYLSRYPDIAQAGVDPFKHYSTHGWRERRQPNAWFDPKRYAAGSTDLADPAVDPFRHFLDRVCPMPQNRADATKFDSLLAFLDRQVAANPDATDLLPSALEIDLAARDFDEAYYLDQYPEAASAGIDYLLHFMIEGWRRELNPNPGFSSSYYLRHNPDVRRSGKNPYAHFLTHGRREAGRAVADVQSAALLDKLNSSADLARKIAAATALDPMVDFPRVPRTISTPQRRADDRLMNAARSIRKALNARPYRYVITVPHIRMSGAARVATVFARTLARLRGSGDILIVITDSAEAEYGHWLPDGVDVFGLAAHLEDLDETARISCMCDLLRGVGCEAVVNVNSGLMWRSLRQFGRQISQECKVITYLFTADETPEGIRVGYPIEWLRQTMHCHHILLTDTVRLERDIAERLDLVGAPGETEILALNTPATEVSEVPQLRQAGMTRPRFLWAGRFDRQKRVDILVEIARDNPQMDFHVYGKQVLDSKPLQDYDPPPNLIPKGTYTALSEVLATPYSGFLYTSQWDGLPTILLDIGLAGLPIVASGVGGISELVTAETGWLVDDFSDTGSYGKALSDIAADPDLAIKRAAAMKHKIQSEFSVAGYEAAIAKVLVRHGI